MATQFIPPSANDLPRAVSGERASFGTRPDLGKVVLPTPMRRFATPLRGLLLFASLAAFGCEEGGVGDPCIPEDEFNPNFPGFARDEVNIESRSFQCRTRVCLVANFQGRVSCRYGQEANGGVCKTPDLVSNVTPAVPAWLVERKPQDAVYCSCRCDGPQSNAPYCECPDGFQCREMLADVGLGDRQLAGKYCIRNGTEVDDPATIANTPCMPGECGDANDLY